MIITDVKPIKLQFWPKNPPRDGLAAIPTRDVFLVQLEERFQVQVVSQGFTVVEGVRGGEQVRVHDDDRETVGGGDVHRGGLDGGERGRR